MELTTKGFLQNVGIILLLVGILGTINVLGPMPESSIFGNLWYFNMGEVWAVLIVGAIMVISSVIMTPGAKRVFAILLGVISAFFGIYSIFSTNFLGAHLEQYVDTIFYIVIGTWGIYCGRKTAPKPTSFFPPPKLRPPTKL